MKVLQDYPFRVLVVDDEERDWTSPMRERLEEMARSSASETNALGIDVAYDFEAARDLLARNYYHLCSFDMRLPEKSGEAISVEHGLALTRDFPWSGFPKRIVFSQTITVDDIRENPRQAARVLQLPADLYAKPTGADTDSGDNAVEVLTVKDWAARVFGYLTSDKLVLERPADAPYHERVETVVGAYLNHGTSLLPPFLAGKLAEIANSWEDKRASHRVDAAIAFIECAMRLAVVQSAVLVAHDGGNPELPADEKLASCISLLQRVQSKIRGWNWSNYLTPQAIEAFDGARLTRNRRVHSTSLADQQKDWTELRRALQYAMDVAAYWVRHPLIAELRYSRDGWSGELLAGRELPFPRRALPSAMDFPTEAVRQGVWQSVWRVDGEVPLAVPVNWDGWLDLADDSDRQWWFPRSMRQNRRDLLSLIDGQVRR